MVIYICILNVKPETLYRSNPTFICLHIFPFAKNNKYNRSCNGATEDIPQSVNIFGDGT